MIEDDPNKPLPGLHSRKYGREAEAADGDDDCEYTVPNTGDGWDWKSASFAVLVTDSLGRDWMIPYGAIMIGSGPHKGNEFEFQFYAGDEVFAVQVKGPQIERAIHKLTLGKRATWHPKGTGTKSITVRKVEQPKNGKSDD